MGVVQVTGCLLPACLPASLPASRDFSWLGKSRRRHDSLMDEFTHKRFFRY